MPPKLASSPPALSVGVFSLGRRRGRSCGPAAPSAGLNQLGPGPAPPHSRLPALLWQGGRLQDRAGNVSSPRQAQCQFQALLGWEEAQGGAAKVNMPVSLGRDWFGTCGPGSSPQAPASASPGSPRVPVPQRSACFR